MMTREAHRTSQTRRLTVLLVAMAAVLLLWPLLLHAQSQPMLPSPYISQGGIVFPLLGPPQAVATATVTSATGARGGATVNYWIVTNALLGQSQVAGPFQISGTTGPSPANALTVTWQPVSGAVSYDLLRSSGSTPPQAACNCAVATGLTTPSYTDTGAALTAYTVNPVNAAALNLQLQNIATGANQNCLAVNNNCIGLSTPITLTTVGSSGAATLTGGVLNIPVYTGGSFNPASPGPIGFTTPGPINATAVNGVVNAASFAGATADVKLSAAITAACAAGVKVVDARAFGAGNQTIASTASLGCSSGSPLQFLFDSSTQFVPASSSIDMFLILPGAKVDGLTANVTGVSGYSGNVIKLAGNIYDNQPLTPVAGHTSLDNWTVYGNGNTTGAALYLASIAGSSDYIQFVDFGRGSVLGMQYGILGVASNSGWINGNNFYGVRVSNAVHGMKFVYSSSGVIQANNFTNYQYEAYTGGTTSVGLDGIWFTGSGGTGSCAQNYFEGTNIWDVAPGGGRATVRFDTNCTKNTVHGDFNLGLAADASGLNYLVDTGTGNSSGYVNYTSGVQTFNFAAAQLFNSTTAQGFQYNGAVILNGSGSNTYIKPAAAGGTIYFQNFGITQQATFTDAGVFTVPGVSSNGFYVAGNLVLNGYLTGYNGNNLGVHLPMALPWTTPATLTNICHDANGNLTDSGCPDTGGGTTVSNLQTLTPWTVCATVSNCGGGATAGTVTAAMISDTTHLSSTAHKIGLSGTNANLLAYWNAGAQNTATNFSMTGQFYVPSLTGINALEYDMFQYPGGGYKLQMGAQCNYAAAVWDIWNQSAAWVHTTIPCNSTTWPAGATNTLTSAWATNPTAYTYQPVALTVNGTVYSLAAYGPYTATNVGFSTNSGVDVQIDCNASPGCNGTTTGVEWVDNLSFTYGTSGGGSYTLPVATSTTLGGVKPDGTSILNTGGAISVTPASVGAVDLTSNQTVGGAKTFTSPVAAPAGIFGSPSTAAQAAIPAGAHGNACDETSTPGVPAAGVDYQRCDSVTHGYVYSCNGSAESSTPCNSSGGGSSPVTGVAAPVLTFSPAAGTYSSTQSVTVNCSVGAPQCATGTTLLSSCAGVLFATTGTLNAGCYGPGLPTTTGSATYTISGGGLANLGNATIEATSDTGINSYLVGSTFVASATGTYSGTAHVYCGNGVGTLLLGVYATSSGSPSGQALIASSGSIACTATAGWQTASITVPVVSGTTYFLGMNASVSGVATYYSATGGNGYYGSFTWTGTLPATAPTMTSNTQLYSEYISQP